jgi:hypothetical protein
MTEAKMQRTQSRTTSRIGIIGLVAILGAVATRSARAGTDFFLSANGDYVTGTWSAGSPPGPGDTAVINGARTANLSSTVSNITTFRLGDGSDGTFNVSSGASLSATGDSFIGISAAGTGTLNQTGGTMGVGGNFFVGFDSQANYLLSGTGVMTVGSNLWFRASTGTVTQSGGTLNTKGVFLGEVSGVNAHYNITGGALNATVALDIGRTGGANNPNTPGQLNVSGTGLVTAANMIFGLDAADQLAISGGGVVDVLQSAYSISQANSDIASGHITGAGVTATTVNLGGTNYTQLAVAPEPTLTGVSALGMLAIGRIRRRRI